MTFFEIKALTEVIDDTRINHVYEKFQKVHENCYKSLVNLESLLNTYNALNKDIPANLLEDTKASFRPLCMTEVITEINRLK